MQERSHKVERLPVHEENKQTILFRSTETVAELKKKPTDTKLTKYFEMCAENKNDQLISSLRYVDFPKHFIWKNGNWQQRKRGGEKVISRMYTCSPRDTERFYLRLLLHHVHGATCFKDVRNVNGIDYNTYEEAARQHGLLDEQNNEVDKCLEEAANYKMSPQLRQLFASILLFCNPEENFKPDILLKKYMIDLSEDYYHKKKRIVGTIELNDNDYNWIIIKNQTLANIEKYLLPYGKTLADFNIIRPNYSLIEDESEFQ